VREISYLTVEVMYANKPRWPMSLATALGFLAKKSRRLALVKLSFMVAPCGAAIDISTSSCRKLYRSRFSEFVNKNMGLEWLRQAQRSQGKVTVRQ
jgi:hypothetical protein